ncbi:high-affinity zinc uptake system protein ZnuA [Spirochaetota bacterium]|nr:high-affinity zinc uptake system protein ZnuA [Spirochaetota bacterium]
MKNSSPIPKIQFYLKIQVYIVFLSLLFNVNNIVLARNDNQVAANVNLKLAAVDHSNPKTNTKLNISSPIPVIDHLIKTISRLPEKRTTRSYVTSSSLFKATDDPHFFSVTPQKLKEFYDCNLYFSIGLEVETPLLKKIRTSHPEIRVVSLQSIFSDDAHSINDSDHHVESHEKETSDHKKNGHDDAEESHDHAEESHDHAEESHDHAENVHFWIDPIHYKKIADLIADTLIEYHPQYKKYYQKNLVVIDNEVKKLDKRFKSTLVKNKSTLYTLHPLLFYLADRYHSTGLKVVSLNNRNHEAPTPREIKSFLTRIKSQAAPPLLVVTPHETSTLNFIQKQYKATTSQSLPVVEINPALPNLLSELTKIITVLEKLKKS